MNISYSWLKDFIDIDIVSPPVEEVAHTLTMLGFAVEGKEELEEDWVFDLDITSNRPDCLCHIGVARELAAYYGLELKAPNTSAPAEDEPAENLPSAVEILDADLCPRYAARALTGVSVGESPQWIKDRLEAVGQRPINNVVDITNYVLLEMNHPLHAFDYTKLSEGRIVVKRAREGEKLTTLDGQEHKLDPSMLAICDAKGPTALAGVMGGVDSEISDNTQAMLLESAYFSPPSIRSTAQRLKFTTEASYRFERGANPEIPVEALNRACQLLVEYASAKCVGPVIDVYPQPLERRQVELTSKRIKQVCGVDIDPGFVTKTLQALEFEVSGEHPWSVSVPGFRNDVELEDDLVEEVLRHYGYDKVPGTYPLPEGIGEPPATRRHEEILIRTLTSCGFSEAINLSFTVPETEASFFSADSNLVPITNPLSLDDTHLRSSLVPGLVGSVRKNLNHGNSEVRLFEVGHVYSLGGGFGEVARLGLIATGSFYSPYWAKAVDNFSFFHLKGTVERLMAGYGASLEFEGRDDVAWLQPGNAARVLCGGEEVGLIGRLHSRLEEEFKFRVSVFAGELNLEYIYGLSLAEPQYEGFVRFPSVVQDVSFVVDKSIEFATMEAAIKALNIPDLRGIQLIDFYQGSKLPHGKVGLTVRLTYANSERTLVQDEVTSSVESVTAELKEQLGIEMRS